jgi:hypothetical protein
VEPLDDHRCAGIHSKSRRIAAVIHNGGIRTGAERMKPSNGLIGGPGALNESVSPIYMPCLCGEARSNIEFLRPELHLSVTAISVEKYWRSEVGRRIERPMDAFGALEPSMPPESIEHNSHRYRGDPKWND